MEDDLFGKPSSRNLDVGQALLDFSAIVFYSFVQYKLYNVGPPEVRGKVVMSEPKSCPNRPTGDKRVRIGSWNLENRDPKDSPGEFEAIGSNIADFQRCPDVIGLSEIGDNDGRTTSGITDADQMLQLVSDAATTACGGNATYAFVGIDPLDRQDGGLPGENIRVAFLHRADKVSLVDRGGAGSATDAVTFDGSSGLSFNPGRIQPSAFEDSRKPLVAEFSTVGSGKRFIMIVNHWNSKGGDDGLFERVQPPVQNSQEEREAQSTAVKSFIDTIPRSMPLFVVGDLNDFYFSNPAQALGLRNL